MFNKLSFILTLIFLIGMALGCDGNRSNSFVYDANTVPANPVIGTLPNPGGGGGGGGGVTATLVFAPTSPLAVTVGGADNVITATGTPAGGTLSLANIVTGGTGGNFTGPAGNTFTFTTSATTTAGTATVDVTYTPLAPDLPVTLTYTVNVSAAAGLTLSFGSVTSVAIPNGTGVGVPGAAATSVIDTTTGGTTTTTASITNVRVLVNITHVARGDLGFMLTNDTTGTTVQLYNTSGTLTPDIRVIFDDAAGASVTTYTAAAVSIAAPFASYPSFTPASALSAATPTGFGGEDANGTWTLTLFDYYSSFGTGTLNGWGLSFNSDPSSPF